MRKTKLYFGILILALIFILIYSIRFDYLDRVNPNNFVDYVIPQDSENTYTNCTIPLPNERTIILRMDDIGVGYMPVYKKLISVNLEKNLSLTLGVIPFDLIENPLIAKYLRNISKSQIIEIAQHGYMHSKSEFGSSTNISYVVPAGRNILIKKAGVIPVTFIPPYNAYPEQTLSILKENGFRILSAGQNNYLTKEGIFILDFNSASFDYDNQVYIEPYKIIGECNKSLNEIQVCVVMLHPQTYGRDSNRNLIDNQKYNDYLEMLDGLKGLNAKFKTFKDLMVC